MDWGSLLLGALLGFALSLVLWWIQLRVVVPRLQFGEGISRLTYDGDVTYRFKVMNEGRRGAVDLAVSVSLHLGNELVAYNEARSLKTFSIVKLHPVAESVVQLRPGVSRVVRLDMRPQLWLDVNPRLLAIAKIDPTSQQPVSLESLLAATPAAYMRVRILANDEVSGTRRYFVSPRYYLGHIRTGTFHGRSVGPSGGW